MVTARHRREAKKESFRTPAPTPKTGTYVAGNRTSTRYIWRRSPPRVAGTRYPQHSRRITTKHLSTVRNTDEPRL